MLTGWDYTINTVEGARNKQLGLAQTLKETLAEDQRGEVRTRRTRAIIYLKRAVINLVVLGVLGGVSFLIYLVAEAYSNHQDSLKALLPAATITLANLLVPGLFEKLAEFEDYQSPRTNLRITIARSFLLRMAGIYVIMVSLFGISIDSVHGQTNTIDCWETVVGQELYRLLMVDFLVDVVATLG